MLYHTRPAASPKPLFPSRQEALDCGAIVDLRDLDLDAPGTILGLPCAITESLLDQVEQIPFGALRSTTVRDRLTEVALRATAALQRVRQSLGEGFPGALRFGFVIDFTAALPCRAADPAFGFLRMHCGPDDEGTIAITLARVDELSVDSPART